LAIVVPFREDCSAKTTFAKSHDGRPLSYEAGRLIHHSLGHDRAQAQAEENADNAQAAYASERKAYLAQVAINREYRHEVAVQHSMIVQIRRQLSAAQRPRQAAVVPVQPAQQQAEPQRVATTSMGWGNL
jgi:hypothetical protein